MLHARPLPTLGTRSPGEGDQYGGQQEGRGAEGLPAFRASLTPPMKGLLCRGVGQGPLGPHPASERMSGDAAGGWPLSTA